MRSDKSYLSLVQGRDGLKNKFFSVSFIFSRFKNKKEQFLYLFMIINDFIKNKLIHKCLVHCLLHAFNEIDGIGKKILKNAASNAEEILCFLTIGLELGVF